MMRKFLKRSLMFVMVLALLLPALPVAMPVSAATVTGAFAPSPCGTIRGAPWRLYSNGTLVVDWGFIHWSSLNSPWYAHRANISSITFTGPITAGRFLRGLFGGLSNVTAIDGLEHFDTGNVTNMNYMFSGASGLTSLDLSSWDVSNVRVMVSMFEGASGLTSLDLSGWDTSSVTDMCSMFAGASGLTSLDLSHFDTSSVENVRNMFNGASGLTNLDLSGWDTSNVIRMNGMFRGASGLTSLDLSYFNSKVRINMDHMFRDASNLVSVDLSGWTILIVGQEMFRGASSLRYLALGVGAYFS